MTFLKLPFKTYYYKRVGTDKNWNALEIAESVTANFTEGPITCKTKKRWLEPV